MSDICPLCQREVFFKSDHHLIPKTRGGVHKEKITICSDCHDAVHSIFSNKELEREYNSVESLMSHEKFAKTIKFLSKQNPKRRYRTKLSNEQRGRGRNG